MTKLELTRDTIADALEDLRTDLFSPEMRLTLIARHPTNPECEIVVSSDDLVAVRATIDRSLKREPR